MAGPDHRLYPLYQTLTKLPPTGENGFEGFLRDAVATVIERSLHLVKSGPQHGADAVVGDDRGPNLAVEAKKYSKQIGVEELSKKLYDAVRNRPNLDVHVFGATTEIPSNDRDELKSTGQREGIGVFFIDWPETSSAVPPLAVLCAIAPDQIRKRASSTSALNNALKAVTEQSDFDDVRSRIEDELCRPDLGYEPLRITVTQWLRTLFADRHSSRARLGRLLNINDKDLKRVQRPKIAEALDNWWQGGAQAPLALIGDEGLGKSWAPLAWWEDRADENGQNLPILVFLPAREIYGIDIKNKIAHEFARISEIRDQQFWQNRVDLWLKAPDNPFKFIIVIDGLNENPTFTEWSRLLSVLQDSPWYDRVSLILTDRSQHWSRTAAQLEDLRHPPERTNVEPFDDKELDALLEGHGLTIQDFASGLKDLLKIPRLSELAIRHRQRMNEAGDMTRERLIYEDWKDRLARDIRGNLISDREFCLFVSRIGEKVRSNISVKSGGTIDLTERELVDVLGADTGDGGEAFQDTLSEIVNGSWMVPNPRHPHKFRLDPSRAMFALGMALVEDLADRDEAEWDDRLAEFLEPLLEQDKAVTILRNAVTIALLDPNVPNELRRLLTRTWVEQRNFGEIDFESFRRLVVPGVGTILELAESYWLSRSGERYVDEVFIKALANEFGGESDAAEKIRRWCAGWLGTYWADPLNGTVLNYDPSGPDVDEREKRTRRRAEQWQTTASKLASRAPVLEREAAGVFWLVCRVVGILSFNSPASGIDGFEAWAISRVIMNHAPEFDQVAWMLRLCDDVDALENVKDAAEELATLDTDVARRAGGNLLSALATPEAARRAQDLGKARDRKLLPHGFVSVAEGQTRIIWDCERAKAARTDPDSPLFFARDLGPFAKNPDLYLLDNDVERLRSLAAETDVSNLFQGRGRTGPDIDVEDAEPALARWAPEELVDLYRGLFMNAARRTDEDLNQIGFKAPSRLFILHNSERSALVDTAKRTNPRDKRCEHAIRRLLWVDLPELDARRQIDKLKRWPNGPVFNKEICSLLATPDKSDFATIAHELTNQKPKEWLCAWLWYLQHAPLDHLPKGYPALIPLFQHSDPVVRTRAFEVVNASADSDLALAVMDSGWRVTENTDRPEALAGSLAMLGSLEHGVPGTEIRKRISREAWGQLAIHASATAEDMNAFAEMLRERLAEDLRPKSPSRRFGGYQIFNERPIERLVASRGDEVARWIEPFIKDATSISTSAFMDSYPYMNICSALLRQRPEQGVRFWWALHEKARQTPFSISSLQSLPFSAPASEPVLELRDAALKTATTDQELETITMALVRTSQEDWLLDRIQRDLQGETAGQLARGLTLAGLLPPDRASHALWATDLAKPPGPGWLAEVHDWAKGRYHEACSAAHWLDAFFNATDRQRAFGYHVLFQRCFARHHLPWVAKRRDAAWSNLSRPWRAHWDICAEDLKDRMKEQEKRHAKTLFGTSVPDMIQWPWK